MHLYGQNKLVNTAQNAYLDTNDYINNDRNRYEIKRNFESTSTKKFFFYKSRNLIKQYATEKKQWIYTLQVIIPISKKSNLYRFLPSQIALIKCHISECYL